MHRNLAMDSLTAKVSPKAHKLLKKMPEELKPDSFFGVDGKAHKTAERLVESNAKLRLLSEGGEERHILPFANGGPLPPPMRMRPPIGSDVYSSSLDLRVATALPSDGQSTFSGQSHWTSRAGVQSNKSTATCVLKSHRRISKGKL